MVLVFCSGAAGLAYEISWSRQLGLAFGHTARAAAIVLAAYFAGMALGYAIAGRISARLRRPLAGFAVAEVLAGLWAFAVPAWLVVAPAAIDDALVRVLVAVLVLLPGTTALGASLPFVAQAIGATRNVAKVYSANLAGAVLGVVGSVAMLAPVGVVATSWVAASVSITVGAAAWALQAWSQNRPSRRRPRTHRLYGGQQRLDPRRRGIRARHPGRAGALHAAVLPGLPQQHVHVRRDPRGRVAVPVPRVALRGVGHATGSTRGDWCSGRRCSRRRGFRCRSTGSCAWRAWTTSRAGRRSSHTSWGRRRSVAAVIVVPMLAMGIILPLAWRLAGADHQPGRVVGRLTTANTLAAAAGAILASFVLLPALDLWWSFTAIASAYLLLAVVAVATRPTTPALGRRDRRRSGGSPWLEPRVLQLRWGAPRRAPRAAVRRCLRLDRRHPQCHRKRPLPPAEHPLHPGLAQLDLEVAPPGASTPAAPPRSQAGRVHRAGDGGHGERRPRPPRSGARDGDGVWSQRSSTPPGCSATRTPGFSDDPRVELVVGDGRNVLGAQSRRYDVIIADLFVPWESKTGYLYTVEHYVSVRDRLGDGGIFLSVDRGVAGGWRASWTSSRRACSLSSSTCRSGSCRDGTSARYLVWSASTERTP